MPVNQSREKLCTSRTSSAQARSSFGGLSSSWACQPTGTTGEGNALADALTV